MAPDDGKWIRDETARLAGNGGWPDGGWPPGPPPGTPKRWGHGGVPGFSVWVAAAVAVLAAAAGVAVGLLLI